MKLNINFVSKLKIFYLALFFISVNCFADIVITNRDIIENLEQPKYNLSVCALFKNKASFLKEWIEYHRLLGVDHFYLYDNESQDHPKQILTPFIEQNIVTLISWPDFGQMNELNCHLWPLTTQITAYENAIKYEALDQTKWLIFLDVEEYLVPSQVDSLIAILDKYDQYSGIDICRAFYDGTQCEIKKRDELQIEAVDLIQSLPINVLYDVSKTIFKPSLCKGFTWPPYKCQFQDTQKTVALVKAELCINHYVNNIVDYKYNHLIGTRNPDQRMFTKSELASCLSTQIDQERLIYRFMPELRKRMGFDHRWNW
jgi:Glycosyltransferase family 92